MGQLRLGEPAVQRTPWRRRQPLHRPGYVVDYFNNRIQRFSSTGAFLGTWGSSGDGDGLFWFPEGVAVSPSTGQVFAADSGNDRIQRFSAAGSFLGTWGSFGAGDGQFNRPAGVAVNPSSAEVYVADTDNSRIQRFRPVGPMTRITRGPQGKTRNRTARFRFRASVAKASFECRLGGQGVKRKLDRWRSCTPPRRYSNLKPGRKVFRVRATDREADTGRLAKRSWKIVR